MNESGYTYNYNVLFRVALQQVPAYAVGMWFAPRHRNEIHTRTEVLATAYMKICTSEIFLLYTVKMVGTDFKFCKPAADRHHDGRPYIFHH